MREYRVGPADQLPEGQPVSVRAGRFHVAVVRAGGRVYALPDHCAHKGASLSRGRVCRRGDDLTLRCPWHGWEWNLETGRLLPYPPKRTATVPVIVVDGEVRLRLP